MKNDNALKKHHFWLLLGFVPLFTLIGVLMVDSSVGGAIAAREKELKDADSQLSAKRNTKSKQQIAAAEQLLQKIGGKTGDLHKTNWERQQHLYTWPKNSALLKEIEQKNLKFGSPLPTDRGEFDEFRRSEVYLDEFSTLRTKDAIGPGTGMADLVTPTQFRGGWPNVLRHVTEWPQGQLNKDQVWLIMEDIWVQRSLLDAVRSVNEEMAVFRRAKFDKDGNAVIDNSFDENGNKISRDKTGKITRLPTPEEEKQKGLFANRTWAVELELVKEGNSLRLTGKLTNLSDRLQLMGVGNIMTLHVWLSKDAAAQPMVFKIGGEYLPGKGAMKRVQVPTLDPDGKPLKDREGKEVMEEKTVPANVLDIVPMDDHILPAGSDINVELVRVEHVFDIRTVPIKRIDAVALGKADSRLGDNFALLPPGPPFKQEEQPDPNATGTPMGMGPPTGMGPTVGTGMGPSPVGTGGNTMPGVPGMPYGQGSTRAVNGPVSAVIDANKKRYVVVSDQVRRMPVGIVVVVDQAYIQDVLLAFANSPLRFQITQVTWTRFRGTLSGLTPGGTTTGPSDDIDYGSGRLNFRGPGDPDARGSLGPRPIAPGPVGPGPVGPGPVAPPPGMGPPPGYPGAGPGAGGYGSGNGGVVSESQITSGLVELSIYGIVSLYEKYVEPQKEPTPDATKTEPAPEPKPEPKQPMQPMPMQPTNPTPKMRRRVRA